MPCILKTLIYCGHHSSIPDTIRTSIEESREHTSYILQTLIPISETLFPVTIAATSNRLQDPFIFWSTISLQYKYYVCNSPQYQYTICAKLPNRLPITWTNFFSYFSQQYHCNINELHLMKCSQPSFATSPPLTWTNFFAAFHRLQYI